MINKVIVCGLRRAKNLVPEMEIRQMIGRAGRSYDQNASGQVILLVTEEDSDMANKYMFGALPSISSKMDNIEDLVFHMLPSIYGGEVYDDVTAHEWYRRTLAFFQSVPFAFNDVFNLMKSYEMVEGDEKRFKITELGKLSCKYYFAPSKIYIWKEKFSKVVKKNYFNDDFMLAWAFATSGVGVNIDTELMDFFDSNNCSSFEYGEKEEAVVYYCLLSHISAKDLKYLVNEYRRDVERTIKVLMAMDEIMAWNVSKEMEILHVRLKEGMDYDSARLAIEINIYNKTLLFKLQEFGIKCFDDLKKNSGKIKKYGDEVMVRQLEEAIGEFI